MIAILVSLLSMLTIIGGIIFYFGQLDVRISVLETAENAALNVTLTNISKQLSELDREQRLLRDKSHEQDIRNAAWDARWGHLINEVTPTN